MARRKYRAKRADYSLTNPNNLQALLSMMGQVPSASGVRVTKSTAFSLPAFYRGVDLIASTCGRVPTVLYKRKSDGGKERAENHPAYRLLKKAPNAYQTAFEYKRQIVSDAIYAGNSYTYVVRRGGRPVELLPLDPDHTWPVVERSATSLEILNISYQTSVEGRPITIDFSDVIHLKGLSCDRGLYGMRLIDVVKDALGLGVAVRDFGARYFSNNCRPGVIIEIPSFLPKEKVDYFKANLITDHRGTDNAHKIMLLQNGAKWVDSKLSAEEAQFLQSREMSATDIANILGVPPHKLGVPIATSYNSLEQENLSLLNDCFDKWFCNLEMVLESRLLTEAEKEADDFFFEFTREKLLAADTSTVTTNIINQLNNSLLSPNEARVILNHDTIKEEWADEYRRPSNLVIEGEEPEPAPVPGLPGQVPPAAEAEAKEPDQEQPQEEPTQEATRDDRGLALTRASVERLLTRIKRHAEAEGRLSDIDLGKHRRVALDGLPIPGAEVVVDRLLEGLQTELRAVCREQVPEVFERVNTQEIAEEIWTR